MTPDTEIQILLATYNGALHLDAFLDSLVAQDYQHWSLLVRDDGSSDATPALLERWQSRLGNRLHILHDSSQCNLGGVVNFSRLLTASTAPYIMFADQDDVWNPEKVSVTLAAMQRREAETGSTRPVLVHTDLTLVDENLRVIAPSYWKYQGIVPKNGHALNHMMLENIASGCTAMLNRPLAELSGEMPREAGLHDWWVSLVAAAFGEIVTIPVQTISWRRHGANDSEITRLSGVFRRTLTGVPDMRRRVARLLENSRPRLRLFLARYRRRLSPRQVADIEAFLALPTLGFFARRRAVLQHRLFFTSWSRTAGMLLLL